MMIPLIVSLCFAEFRDIHVLFCMDDHLQDPTSVALTSMFGNANQNTFYCVHIQIPGCFKPEIKLEIESLKLRFNNFKIEFLDMGDIFHDLSGRFPHCALYYLLAANIFPYIEKIIYLDGDIIVRHDLCQLYDTNIEEYYVAGVRDPLEVTWGLRKAKKKVEMLNIPDLKQYINTGVLLLSLEKIRVEEIEKKFLVFIEREKKRIVSREFYGDQDIVNPVCYGKILVLPVKFNAMVNMINFLKPFEENEHGKVYSQKDWIEVCDPTIIHFAAGPKPWKNLNKTKYHREWMVYFKRSRLRKKHEKTS